MDLFNKFKTPVFNIAVGICENDNTFAIENLRPIKCINSSRNVFASNPVIIEADPFLYVKDGILYLFYEELKEKSKNGILKMVSTSDLKEWTKPNTVLEEPFHLSYPNVFDYYGHTYMLPETGHNNDIRLYEMSDDMKSCQYVKTLVEGNNFVDSTILRHNNTNYLFTSIFKGNGEYEGRIYIGDDNLDNWRIHPASPFSNVNKDARCGGAIIKEGGNLYRIAQDCSGNYGGGLNAMHIDNLTPTSYKESFAIKLLPTKAFPHGGHQFSEVTFGDKRIVTVDYLSNSLFLRDILSRIISKIN